MSRYYDINTTNNYHVQYKGKLIYKQLGEEQKHSITMQQEKHPSIDVFFTASEKKRPIQRKTSNFSGCSTSQIDLLNDSHTEAIRIAKDASDTLDAAMLHTSGTRYRLWFGLPDNQRQLLVTNNFNKIYTALDTENIHFNCDCTEDIFAYVYPSEHYNITLCNTFWEAEIAGSDSKSGTIIHEMTHFNVIGSTEDYKYGTTDTLELAIDNPQQAVNNADNYEYFAENTPQQDMENPFSDAVNIHNIMNDLPLDAAISVANERDNYVFIAPVTATYTLYTTGTLDTIGALFGSNYLSLASNDDIDEDTNRNYSITYPLIQGRTYYLGMVAYQDNNGSYTLNSSIDADTIDTDNDGTVDITDTDDDNDGVVDTSDAFPLDASESVDTDNDGIGNNADTDDDGDGISDSIEIANGLDPLNTADGQADFDNDGFSNALELSIGTDMKSASSYPKWAPVIMGDILIFIPSK